MSLDAETVAPTCPVCLNALKGLVGFVDACDHAFCFSCLKRWAATQNVCPLDRRAFHSMTKVCRRTGELLEEIAVPDAKVEDADFVEEIVQEHQDWIESIVCETCKGGNDEEVLLLCDSCNLGYHTFCLEPPLSGVPAEKQWFCLTCTIVKNT